MVRVGLIGLGRLGHIYADILSTKIPNAKLQAIAGRWHSQEIAEQFHVPYHSEDRLETFKRTDIDAFVIVSSTDTHVQFCTEAMLSGRPVFCEKPLSLELNQSVQELAQILIQTRAYFQMGFMRRFDPGYQKAKESVGLLGQRILFRSTSRDATPPSLTYAKTSGGLLLDMGIHDFDLARWLMDDEVIAVSTIGGCLVSPELETIGDIDNAIVTLAFQKNTMGVIDLSRNATYGYDVATEVMGSQGTLRIGYLQQTPTQYLSVNRVCHDTVPTFAERFQACFTTQLQNFIDNVEHQRPSPVTLYDGIKAQAIAKAAKQSLEQNSRWVVV